MKTLVISLAKIKERREYIIDHVKDLGLDYTLIEAIDGSLLTEEYLTKVCDMKEVNKLRWWLTNGAIGCALSHYNAYEHIVTNNLKSAFIIEDDAVLPDNINKILSSVENEIMENEILLLYYASFQSCKLSETGKTDITSNISLVYPMDIKQIITATAYVISNKAAKGMIGKIKPIRVAADTWHYYYDKGAFTSLRVLYPNPIKTKNFKSSIDYFNNKSIKGILSYFINTFKIPLLFQLLRYMRTKRRDKMLNQFSLTNEVSPIYKEIKSSFLNNFAKQA